MTTISMSDIQHLADLASLALSEEEAVNLRQDLENIISYVEQLSQLDTGGVDPTYQVTGLNNVWREDEVRPGVDQQTLLELAPDRHGNQVKVPKVL